MGQPPHVAKVGDVDAALMLFEPGEQVGPAVADLLFGKASPGGRLPVSFPEVSEKRFTQEKCCWARAGGGASLRTL